MIDYSLLSLINPSSFRNSFTHRLIEDEKELLENELRDYQFKAGGILALDMIFIANVSSESLASLRKLPVQAMVATTWRSGSTFLGISY